jgi:putative FmdB family regulatory protein
MPTYDYKCSECGVTFEETHGVDHRVESCPECGGKVRRIFHPVGIIFKGSGFYKTDSRASSDNGGQKSATEKKGKKSEKPKTDSPKDKGDPPRSKESTGSSS